MSRRYYNLPPLTTLAAFEAAARHGSFKDAAQELSVTPGAVSHQIKALEGDLGAALFFRKHRGVELSSEGQKLFESLAGAFLSVSQCLQGIRRQNAENTVTLGSTTAVATLWSAPLISRFWRSNGDIDVNQVVSDQGFGHVDAPDLLIRYGREPGSKLHHEELYRDHLVPVATPEIAARINGGDLADLAQQRLIHLESKDRTWTSWYDWFGALGYQGRIADGVRVNNYTIALQAARDGIGVALGWQRLIRPLLADGHLVPIGPHVLAAPKRFHLVSKPVEELPAGAKLLHEWILAKNAAPLDPDG